MQKSLPIAHNSAVETQTVVQPRVPSTTVEAVSRYTPQNKYRQMKTLQGGSITVGEHSRGFEFPQYKGKIVLLDFFGKECHYCFEEMPTITKIQNRYRDRLSVIAIQASPPMAKGQAQRLIQEHNMNYPVIDQNEAKSILIYLRDVYHWRGILPYIMLIKDGQIEQVFQGAKSFEEISQGIKEIR
jgi:thiol-disulfide isomerase/thioredoxin